MTKALIMTIFIAILLVVILILCVKKIISLSKAYNQMKTDFASSIIEKELVKQELNTLRTQITAKAKDEVSKKVSSKKKDLDSVKDTESKVELIKNILDK